MNALKYQWCETAVLSQDVLKHAVPKEEACARDRFCILRKMNKSLYCSISKNFHVMLHYFKKRNFNMSVTHGLYVGHIWIVLWVVGGSNRSTGTSYFQP